MWTLPRCRRTHLGQISRPAPWWQLVHWCRAAVAISVLFPLDNTHRKHTLTHRNTRSVQIGLPSPQPPRISLKASEEEIFPSHADTMFLSKNRWPPCRNKKTAISFLLETDCWRESTDHEGAQVTLSPNWSSPCWNWNVLLLSNIFSIYYNNEYVNLSQV